MLIKVKKWASVLVLLLAVTCLASESLQVLLPAVVCMLGLLVATQAIHSGKYVWAVASVAIAVAFNPVLLLLLSRRIFIWLDLISLMTLLISLTLSKSGRRPSVVSMTNQMQRARRYEERGGHSILQLSRGT